MNRQSGRPKRPKSRGPIVAALLAVSAGAGFLALFSDNIVKVVSNAGKLVGYEPVTISLPAATMTIKNPRPAPADGSLPIQFTVVVTGHRTNIECKGEAEGQGSHGEQIKLSSEDEAAAPIDRGRERKQLTLHGSIPQDLKLTLLNFRLTCGNLGPTEWVPVDVVVESTEVSQISRPQVTRPRQSFRVCAGNGGGPSCSAQADASLTCAQYRGIGGGAQATYDALAKRFCEYRDGDKTVSMPNQVLHNFSRDGGECGWTEFTVVCNP